MANIKHLLALVAYGASIGAVSYLVGERDATDHLMDDPRALYDEMRKRKEIVNFEYHSAEGKKEESDVNQSM